jgi:hypothetical protein
LEFDHEMENAMIRKTAVLVAGLAMTAGVGLVGVGTAPAATPNPYGSGGRTSSGGSASPDTITGPKYDFCFPGGCPYTVWTVDYSTGKFKDSLVPKDKGTFTHVGKYYTFVFPNVGGTGVSCTFLGKMNTADFNSAADPGTYTCGGGGDITWYALKI